MGYSVLRDFLFPVGRGTRFEVDEGGVAALSVGFVVSLAGFKIAIAGRMKSAAIVGRMKILGVMLSKQERAASNGLPVSCLVANGCVPLYVRWPRRLS